MPLDSFYAFLLLALIFGSSSWKVPFMFAYFVLVFTIFSRASGEVEFREFLVRYNNIHKKVNIMLYYIP